MSESDEPFAADGSGERGEIGIVLSHGFTGTPASVRDWADVLADAGYTVRAPLLPGHGTSWQHCNTTRWPQWYATVEQTYEELQDRCSTVFGFGLSMGGAMMLRLAEVHPDGLAGVVVVNPFLKLSRIDARFVRYVNWAMRSRRGMGSDIKKPGAPPSAYPRVPLQAFASLQEFGGLVVKDLPKITCPVRLYRSREDHLVDPLSGQLLVQRVTATTVEEIILENSYHVATLDNDAELIFGGSLDFVEAQLSERADDAA